MKTTLKNSKAPFTARIIIIALLLLPWLAMNADDYTKTYQEKYDVDKGASLVIENKFGDIHCQAWDESSVSIVVTVKVDASSQEKADKFFDRINVELTGSRTKVQGVTSVDNINNANLSINYEIRMPRWITIDLDNKFGDIYLDESDGSVKINLEYGAMEANAFNGLATELDIKFSEVKTGYIKDGNVNIEYSEWESKGGEFLKLYSRFSEVTIEKTANLNMDSQYDDIFFGNAGQVIAISRFSDLELEKINGDFDFDVEYGDLTVKNISATFKNGKVRNTFAGASLTFDPKANITIDAEIEFGELSYPKSNASMNEEIIGYTTHIYKGRIGAAGGSSSKLTVITKNADVNLDFAE